MALFLLIRLSAVELYVSPDGNDNWSGILNKPNADRTDGPLATLQGARDQLRKLNRVHEATSVIVADGFYEMNTTLEFLPQDSGTAEFPITYRAADGAKPVFSGGRIITGWKQESTGVWSTNVEEAVIGRWIFEQLWVNGARATRARHPNHGFLRVDSATEEASPTSETEAPRGWSKQTIGMKRKDLDLLAGLMANDREAVQVVVQHFWETTRRYLAGLDPATGVLTFTAPRRHPYAGLKAGDRYYLENALPFLDAPGEWFLSHNGRLYYRPRSGEDMTKANVVAPRLTALISFKGDLIKGHFVEHLSFQGLMFSHSQWITPPNGVFPIQAAVSVDAAIMADATRYITLENCEISHTGKYALWFRYGCNTVLVRHCLFYDLGGGGIRIGPEKFPIDAAQRTFAIEIDNNIVCHGGRIFAAAVGIWIGTSSENKITHNDVSDFYNTGISVGWEWGYAASTASGNHINFNHVHHLGWGLLNDMGGIYTLGVSPGTECIGNVIHDIEAERYGGWGLYFDEGSSGILAEKNLVYATSHGGFHQHYGRDNMVRNNIFALNHAAQLQLTRSEPNRSLTFEHNIVYWQRGEPFAGKWGHANIHSDHNLFFRSQNGFTKDKLLMLEAQDHDLHSMVADPGFTSPLAKDFTFRGDSPAFQIGFTPIDYSKAGVYGSDEWRRRAHGFSKPAPPDANN